MAAGESWSLLTPVGRRLIYVERNSERRDKNLWVPRRAEAPESRRLKGFRRICSRFEKLDVLFIGFLDFAVIVCIGTNDASVQSN
jgi:hypothetical protein